MEVSIMRKRTNFTTFTTKPFDQEKMQKCICILCPHSDVCDLKNAVDHTDPNSLCEVQLKDNIIGRKNVEVIALYELL